MGFPSDSAGKTLPASAGYLNLIVGLEDPLEEEVTNHSSILA